MNQNIFSHSPYEEGCRSSGTVSNNRCRSRWNSLIENLLHTPGIKILGIADLDLQSPGIQLARKHGIFTTRNFHDLLSKPGKR